MRETKYGNKGQNFEGLIKYANAHYKHNGAAVIEKQNTLCIPLRNGTGKIVSAKYEEKATVDFMGRIGNIPLAFEAKHCSTPVVQWSRVEPHQSEWLNTWSEDVGAIAFILVSFNLTDFYLIPWQFWVEGKRANALKKGVATPPNVPQILTANWEPTGKASVRQDELPEEWRVLSGGVGGLDYLNKVADLWSDTGLLKKKKAKENENG